jgi:hyperosmotically inducible protein
MKTIKNRILALIGLVVLMAATAVADPVRSLPSRTSLEERVRHELVTLPYYGVFDNLAFQVNGGTVTLYGQVVQPTTKSDAARRVARLAGVNRVVNKIDVLPLSPFDDSLRRRTYRAVFGTAGLSRYAMGTNPSIHIVVDHGRVTLEGVVSNSTDAQLAYMAARSVPGAFSVTNNLQIEQRKAY